MPVNYCPALAEVTSQEKGAHKTSTTSAAPTEIIIIGLLIHDNFELYAAINRKKKKEA